MVWVFCIQNTCELEHRPMYEQKRPTMTDLVKTLYTFTDTIKKLGNINVYDLIKCSL